MIHQAIYTTHSNVSGIRDNEDGSVTAFDIEGSEVTLDGSEITEANRLQAEYDDKQYSRDRAEAYPSIGDQLDMIFHAGLGGDEFQAAIQAVKDAHPKGGN